jgi:hypothetical protein
VSLHPLADADLGPVGRNPCSLPGGNRLHEFAARSFRRCDTAKVDSLLGHDEEDVEVRIRVSRRETQGNGRPAHVTAIHLPTFHHALHRTVQFMAGLGYDTVLPACSVEFCPTPGLENLFAVGTYKLEDSANPGVSEQAIDTSTPISAPQKRRGECLLFQMTAEAEDGAPMLLVTSSVHAWTPLDSQLAAKMCRRLRYRLSWT